MQSHKDLLVWQEAMVLVEGVYSVARAFPKVEQFGLFSQVTRAAVSIPANLAEGNGRSSRKEYAHFISISRGSLSELETLLLIAVRLHYLEPVVFIPLEERMHHIGRLLTGLYRKLSQPPA